MENYFNYCLKKKEKNNIKLKFMMKTKTNLNK